MYSAGGSLNKEEVEGRIFSLLQGFDKVCSFSLPAYLSWLGISGLRGFPLGVFDPPRRHIGHWVKTT